jgi:hypothetical protein
MLVTLRDPTTGYTITSTDDAATQPFFIKKFFVHRPDPQFNPPVGQGWGTLTVHRTQMIGVTVPDPVPAGWVDVFSGTALDPAWRRAKSGAGTTTTSTVLVEEWTIAAGAAPTNYNRWLRPITGVVKDGVKQYRYSISYSSFGGTTAVMRIVPQLNGSESSPMAGPINLNSAARTTATGTFTIPATAMPAVLISAADTATRAVMIDRIAIEEVV